MCRRGTRRTTPGPSRHARARAPRPSWSVHRRRPQATSDPPTTTAPSRARRHSIRHPSTRPPAPRRHSTPAATSARHPSPDRTAGTTRARDTTGSAPGRVPPRVDPPTPPAAGTGPGARRPPPHDRRGPTASPEPSRHSPAGPRRTAHASGPRQSATPARHRRRHPSRRSNRRRGLRPPATNATPAATRPSRPVRVRWVRVQSHTRSNVALIVHPRRAQQRVGLSFGYRVAAVLGPDHATVRGDEADAVTLPRSPQQLAIGRRTRGTR